MKNEIVIGIDPGVSGAWAVTDGEEIAYFKYPGNVYDVIDQLRYLLDKGKVIKMAVLEKVSGDPRWGYRNFTFGMNFGEWKGILSTLGIPYCLVAPGVWQRSILDSVKKTPRRATKKNSKRDKGLSVEFLQRRYPKLNLLKSYHNQADAICMALYAKKHT